ncbi:ATP synthase subunit d, mitochondrial, partial [Plecturocebus cupreus]
MGNSPFRKSERRSKGKLVSFTLHREPLRQSASKTAMPATGVALATCGAPPLGILVRHMHANVHCSTVYNSKDLEPTQMPIDDRMDRENVAYIHHGIPCSHKKDKFVSFVGTWMNLETIILSKLTLAVFPENPPSTDWAYYKANVAKAGLVDGFEKKFNALKVPLPEDPYTALADAEEKEDVKSCAE